MRVTPEEVMRIARLAELSVASAELPALTAEMDRIVMFVAQLSEPADSAPVEAIRLGPARSPLRQDLVRPSALQLSPKDLGPASADGFFLVPRLEALDER